MFDISISTEGKKVVGRILVDSYFFEEKKYDYAFYLYKNDERIDTVWYSESMEVIFECDNISGFFHIRAFIRDKEHRNIRFFNSEKISIDS